MNQWSTKYRPTTLKQIAGNKTAKAAVRRLIENKDSHCVLISGKTGCAKTTFAKIIANAFSEGVTSDVEELNCASDGGIDKIRGMIDRSRYLPSKGYKVNILEECHALTSQAKKSLLRPVEEPPHNRLLWLMVTNQPWQLDKEFIDRCKHISVSPPTKDELVDYLWSIAEKEDAFSKLDDDDLEELLSEIADASDLVPRAAVQLLDSVSTEFKGKYDLKEIIVNSVKSNIEKSTDKNAMLSLACLYNTTEEKAFITKQLLAALNKDDSFVMLGRMLHINHALLMKMGGDASPAAHYYEKELKSVKSAPKIESLVCVGILLSAIKQELTQINVDPAQYIVPRLLNHVNGWKP